MQPMSVDSVDGSVGLLGVTSVVDGSNEDANRSSDSCSESTGSRPNTPVIGNDPDRSVGTS